ncbi:hypothetical protein B0H11DRAFT_2239940 [Mycena galericulata]|nr:hypothetical protein B0H11DRAFT_2239940 [Mycena galericulata]
MSCFLAQKRVFPSLIASRAFNSLSSTWAPLLLGKEVATTAIKFSLPPRRPNTQQETFHEDGENGPRSAGEYTIPPGRLGNLTPAQEAALATVSAQLRAEGTFVESRQGGTSLLRFLRRPQIRHAEDARSVVFVPPRRFCLFLVDIHVCAIDSGKEKVASFGAYEHDRAISDAD